MVRAEYIIEMMKNLTDGTSELTEPILRENIATLSLVNSIERSYL